MFAITSVVAEVAERCFPKEAPQVRTQFRAMTTRLEAYVLANSPEVTAADLARFRHEQGGANVPADKLCRGEAAEMYRVMSTKTDQLRAAVDKAVAKPGKPTWGTCF